MIILQKVIINDTLQITNLIDWSFEYNVVNEITNKISERLIVNTNFKSNIYENMSLIGNPLFIKLYDAQEKLAGIFIVENVGFAGTMIYENKIIEAIFFYGKATYIN